MYMVTCPNWSSSPIKIELIELFSNTKLSHELCILALFCASPTLEKIIRSFINSSPPQCNCHIRICANWYVLLELDGKITVHLKQRFNLSGPLMPWYFQQIPLRLGTLYKIQMIGGDCASSTMYAGKCS